MKFNLGERVKVINDHYHIYDSNRAYNPTIVNSMGCIIIYYPVNAPFKLYGWHTQGENRYMIRLDDGQSCLVRERDLELVNQTNKKGVIMKLNLMMRRLLNADVKKLIKAGLMNGDLLLTEEGKNAVYAILVETYKKELVEIAKEIIDEEKEEK